MAELRIASPVAEMLLFGFADKSVHILDVRFDQDRSELVVDIIGEDVPEVPVVTAICRQQRNNAGQHFTTMTFEAVP